MSMDMPCKGVEQCQDCGKSVGGGFMLADHVWLSVARKDEVLCLQCICERLGMGTQGLTPGMFKDVRINRTLFQLKGWMAHQASEK